MVTFDREVDGRSLVQLTELAALTGNSLMPFITITLGRSGQSRRRPPPKGPVGELPPSRWLKARTPRSAELSAFLGPVETEQFRIAELSLKKRRKAHWSRDPD